MTDAQKIEALTDLLYTASSALYTAKYDIEDVSEASHVVREADHYQQQYGN